MAKKMASLHVGVSMVDETHYNYAFKKLACCRTDALAMKSLAEILGYDRNMIHLLLDEQATVRNVKDKITKIAGQLRAGDLFLFTYSGHGGKFRDLLANSLSRRGKTVQEDESFCLYDRQLLDKEMPHLWALFQRGVQVTLLIDSCHSGGAIRADLEEADFSKFVDRKSMERMLEHQPPGAAAKNRETYEAIKSRHLNPPRQIPASFIQLAACRADEVARAGFFLSKYTRLLLKALSDGVNGSHTVLQESLQLTHETLMHQNNEVQTPIFRDQIFSNSQAAHTTAAPFLLPGMTYNRSQEQEIAKLVSWVKENISQIIRERPTALMYDLPDKGETTGLNAEIEPITTELKGNRNPWDAAYQKHYELRDRGIDTFVEPAFHDQVIDETAYHLLSNKGGEFLRTWPYPKPQDKHHIFSWHLADEFSELQKAREKVLQHFNGRPPSIRVAHIDTGVRYEHVAMKDIRFNRELSRSFIPGEKDNQLAEDLLKGDKRRFIFGLEYFQRWAEQDFHGTATLAFLAGGHVGAPYTYGGFEGSFGGAPFAEIVPLRISETVALTGLLSNTSEFYRAVRHAVNNDCRVISMSMAGNPSKKWAEAINYAYENGVVVVTAAGNSWRSKLAKYLPKKLLYPARFHRVIAATGITYNQEPYVFKANSFEKTAGGEDMQGNFGPPEAMDYAMAAYTPNVPWAMLDEDKNSVFVKSGGGTSSATPQIAAAAALYMTLHREAMEKEYGPKPDWRWAEATRQALFESADDSYQHGQTYYGRGALRAFEALNRPVPPEHELTMAPEDKIKSRFGTFISIFIGKGTEEAVAGLSPQLREMIELEALQVLHKDPQLMGLAASVEDFSRDYSEKVMRGIFKRVQHSKYASEFLQKLELP